MPGNNRAVFLDRDGTIIEDPGYLNSPDQIVLLDGAAEAIARLRQEGFFVILATNQSVIARGELSEQGLGEIHERLGEMLADVDVDAVLDGIYYCPFHPEAKDPAYRQESYLRKPRPGMLFKAAREFQLDLGACWMVGDGERDVQAAQTAGCRAIRIHHDPECDTAADAVRASLRDAVDVILASPGRTPLRSHREPEPAPAPPQAPAAPAAEVQAEPADAQPAPAEAEVEQQVEPETEPALTAWEPDPPSTEEPPMSPTTTDAPEAAEADEQPQPDTARRPLGQTRRRLLQQVEQELQEKAARLEEEESADDAAAEAETDADATPARRKRARRDTDMRKVLAEILQQLRQLNRAEDSKEFSATKILGGLFQVVSWAMLAVAMVNFWDEKITHALVWGMVGVFTQVASLAFFLMHQQD